MGVAAHRPAVSPQWLNRSEVPVGTVKAGRMARRNSFFKRMRARGPCDRAKKNGLRGKTTRQAVTPDLKGAAAFDPTASAARCKVVSLIRDISDGASDGRNTFRNRPAQGSNVLRKGENANPTGMVRRIGY